MKTEMKNCDIRDYCNAPNTDGWRIVIHAAEDGGYWGEVPAMPGCVSEGESVDECRANVLEAARGCFRAYLKMAIDRLAATPRQAEAVLA